MEQQELAVVNHLVFLDEHDHPLCSVDQRQVLLVDAHDVRHEGLLRGFDEVGRQVGHVHVAPLEGQDHPHEGFYDECGEVLVVGGEDDLLFLQDGGEDGPEGVGGEGEVEDVANFVEGLAVEAVEVEHFAVGGLLDEDGLAVLVLVAAVDVVVEGELGRRRGLLGLGGLLHGYVLPLLLPLVLQQVQVHLVQSLVDGVRDDRLRLLQLAVHLQQVHLDLVVRHVAHQHQALRHVELPEDLATGLEQPRLPALQRRLLVVDLRGAVVPDAVALRDHEVFPALLEGGIGYFFDLDLVLVGGVPGLEVD